MIDIYMDESGIHDGAPAVTSSAVWARPSVWRAWTREWSRLLPPIDVFHAAEAHGRKGQFKGWSFDERNAFVLKLLPLFPRYKLHGRFGGVHLHEFNRWMESDPEAKALFGDPYYACIQWTFRRVCEHAQRVGTRRLAFIHETSNTPGYVHEAFDYTKRRFPDLSMTLAFGTKQDFVPLQAADVVAYEGYKFLEGGVQRKPMAALDPTGKRMFMMVYGKETAGLMAAAVKQGMRRLMERDLSE